MLIRTGVDEQNQFIDEWKVQTIVSNDDQFCGPKVYTIIESTALIINYLNFYSVNH